MAYYDQQQFDVRCEWGSQGLSNLAPSSIVIIVDVLSFTTSVEIAVSQGVTVFPFPSGQDEAPAYAVERNAQLAGHRSSAPGKLTLSPASLTEATAGTRLVLPSPNGSALSFQAADNGATVIAGCLRNASALAAFVSATGSSITVIPAGERWPDRTLRPAFEDMIGAGAIISKVQGTRSPEAQAAVPAFEESQSHLLERLQACSSGFELIERGFERDVELAAQLNVSQTVPMLEVDAFVAAKAN